MNHTPIPALQNRSATPRQEAGGLALLDGVMIRSRTGYAVAVRRPGGSVLVQQVPYAALTDRFAALRLPFVRGFAGLLDLMVVGTRALFWSAEVREGSRPSRLPRSLADGLRTGGVAGAVLLSALLMVLVFLVLPDALAALAGMAGPLAAWAGAHGTLGFSEENHPFAFNLLAGLFRLAVLVVYVAAIGLHPDIRRVFAFHGAEHMAVADFEARGSLTVESAATRKRLHPRCGTMFLALSLLLAVVVFAATDALLAACLAGFPDWPLLARKATTLAAHLSALPLITGCAWETIRLCAARPAAPWARALLWPGLTLQRLTTRAPGPAEVEVALLALVAALDIEPGLDVQESHVVRGLHYVDETPQRVRIQRPTESLP